MKKIVTILAALTLVIAGVFAEDAAASREAKAGLTGSAPVDSKTRIIEVEDKYAEFHPKASNVKLEIEYTPLTDEVKFFYTCMAASYDQGEAMNTAMNVLLDFQKENQYMHYTYKAKDKTKYFKDDRNIKMTTYTSYVIFSR